jgi:hypothetical protein
VRRRIDSPDVNGLIGDIQSLETNNGEQNVGDSIYVGDTSSLFNMAMTTDMDGNPTNSDLIGPASDLLFNDTPPTVTLQTQPDQSQQGQ